jgi:hypothetical protein
MGDVASKGEELEREVAGAGQGPCIKGTIIGEMNVAVGGGKKGIGA